MKAAIHNMSTDIEHETLRWSILPGLRFDIHTHVLFMKRRDVPAEQTPTMRPSMCLGGFVSLIIIHPKAEPNKNVTNMFNGMNHLIMKIRKCYKP